MIYPADQRASHAYFDSNLNCKVVKVLPGEYYISQEDERIVTVLGSCVSACIHDPVARLGGMNHFMLPDSTDPGEMTSLSMRYGGCAMEVLINELLKAGARRTHLEAKVFGGGNVLPKGSHIAVGAKNSLFVKEYLQTECIPIVAADLDKTWGRKVLFDPRTGKVLVKKVMMERTEALIRHETEYARTLKRADTGGSIELF